MTTDKGEILSALKTALVGAYYTGFKYYVTAFECELFNDKLGLSAYLTLSDIELADKVEWNRWVHSFPFNIENNNGPEEPARVFLMGLLTQAQIQSVEEEHEGTLILGFQNGLKVRLMGEVEIEDISWAIEFRNSGGTPIGNCTCSFNKLYLNASRELKNRLDIPSH
ncbi:hypothetical protein [Hymenobacter sp. APR13]|uniref:hypothetical protein n=1 Tax=Hymenobacter sp. APR13 TaxID=1356852 RepID=UPI0004E098AE|nr:hypothetical protein [Hymenobacter sp. APR13]AII50915.1 hypothetical protein N008_02825 [Hymenobacter sp. APR13]